MVAPTERTPESDPDLGRVAMLGRRWWWLLLLAAVAAGLLSAALGSRGERLYQARAQLLVGGVGGDFNSLRAAGQEAQTIAELAVTRPVLVAVERQVTPAVAGSHLRGRVRAAADPTSRVVTILAKAPDPRAAAVIANAIARQTIDATAGSTTQLRVVDPAQPPTTAQASGVRALAMIAALTGALLVLMALLIDDYFRGRVVNEDELGDLTDAPHLATLRSRCIEGGSIVPRPSEIAAQEYQLLAGRISLSSAQDGRYSVVVTGVQAGERSGDIAANLAMGLAANGVRVVLLDADLEAGDITRGLALDGRLGLRELLSGMAGGPTVDDLLVEHPTGMHVLPRGAPARQRVVDGRDVARVLDGVLRRADVTVISAGPATASAAALAWARCADGTLLVARRGQTRRDSVKRARRALAEVGGRLQGTVLADPPRVPHVDPRAVLGRVNATWVRLVARAQGTGQAPS